MIRQPRVLSMRRRQTGFTLIEVMIALLVLAVGLLGFALLQTMNVRFTKSAQQRTVASNLAYELIDIMRSQRVKGSHFNRITYASFAGVTGQSCLESGNGAPADNIARWKCQVVRDLPDGKAQVELSPDGELAVTVKWGDSTWETDVDKQVTAFNVRSRL